MTNEVFSDSELGLNEGEEFLILSKSNPGLFLKSVNRNYIRCFDDLDFKGTEEDWETKNYTFVKDTYHAHKNDVEDDAYLTWNNLISQRKRIKKTQSLYYFLNGLNGRLNADFAFFQGKMDKERRQHIYFAELNASYGPAVPWDIVKDFELRKYNPKTKKLADVLVDFDCHAYARSFNEVFKITQDNGEAVADVVKELLIKDKLSEYNYIVSTKFDYTKYQEPQRSWYYKDTPKEKDVMFDVVFKTLKLKKDEHQTYNKNGFAAIAFKALGEAEQFVDLYKSKDKDKKVSIVKIDDLMNNNRYELNWIKDCHLLKATNNTKKKIKL